MYFPLNKCFEEKTLYLSINNEPWQIVNDICLPVSDQGDEVCDWPVQVRHVGLPVGGHSLVKEPHLSLRLHLGGLHHDGHGVGLLHHRVQYD